MALGAVLLAVASGALTRVPAGASPAQEYSGPYFGADNFPPGCIRDSNPTNPANTCFHLKTDLNALDSPQVDVLVLVPVSPAAERDMRISRQAVEMWEGGIDYLAPQMGLDWLAEGMDFHITVDYVDPSGEGGEFTTYPIVDPEIVVVTGNPAPVLTSIGIDPASTLVETRYPVVKDLFPGEDMPCHGLRNPFDFEYWQSVPGFDSHHGERSGTYVEDCGGGGGNICFAVNGAMDLAPEMDSIEALKRLFDLVGHEVGHCLTLGHVGDEQMSPWGPVPYDDLMSYNDFPRPRNSCVSTLDVEGIALRMSRYLDVNGDGVVDASDRLLANDQVGLRTSPVQVQHPDDHLHASSTGAALDCPQPDLGLVPGERTDWTPEPADTVDHLLELSGPTEGTVSDEGRFVVAGTVERRSQLDRNPGPTGSVEDERGDSNSPFTDILGVSVELTATDVVVTMRMAEMWTATDLESPVAYKITVNGSTIVSYKASGTTYPEGTATWNVSDKTVTVRRPRVFVAGASPYYVTTSADLSSRTIGVTDDHAPEPGHFIEVGEPVADCGEACPEGVATGRVQLYVDDAPAAGQDVDTSRGPGSFSLPVDLAEGTHVLRVDWEDGGEVVATRSVTVTHNTDDDGDGVPNPVDACPGSDDRIDEDSDRIPDGCDPDVDGDGDANGADNCPEKPNPDQADMDGDAKGDVCDSDMDGDGYSNGREVAAGTDPADPGSYPGVRLAL